MFDLDPPIDKPSIRARTLRRWRRVGGAPGKRTVCEVLFFTVHHTAHHARRLRQRRAEGAER